MRWFLLGGLIAGGLVVFVALVGLQPTRAAPASVSAVSSSDPVIPIVTAERSLDPGPGLFPGAARVHPVSGDVWVCRRGGATILRGGEIQAILPGPCELNFHAQTERWWMGDGRSVVIMSGTTPVARVNLPYTVTQIVEHPRTHLIYAAMRAQDYSPVSTHLAVIRDTNVLTVMSAPSALWLVPHPGSGDLYLGVYTGTYMLWILSGTERVASVPLSGPLHYIEYHPVTRLTYVASQGELKVLNGRVVSASLPVTEIYQIAVDPSSERAYATHLVGDHLTVLSRTEQITQIPFPHGDNPIAVVPGSGEIVAGAFFSQEVHVFSRNLMRVNVISMPVRPRAIAVHPEGWVYVSGWGTGDAPLNAEAEPSALGVLSRSAPITWYANGFGLGAIARAPDGERLYALDAFEGHLYVLSGTEVLTSSALSPWTVSSFLPRERRMALDPGTGWVYIASPQSLLLWMVQGNSWITRSLEQPLNTLAADPAHGVIWGGSANFWAPSLFAISGTAVSPIPIGTEALSFYGPVQEIGIDPVGGYLYARGPYQLAVLSLTVPLTASSWLTIAGLTDPTRALAVQPMNGLAYVGAGIGPTGTLWIFQGPTPVARRTLAGVPVAMAADPGGGWVYAALSGTSQVVALTGTQIAFTVSLPFEARRIWVSPRSHLVYAAGEFQVAALAGPIIRRVLTTGIGPEDMAFDPVNGLAILSHVGDNRLVWIEERALSFHLWLPAVWKGP